MTHGLRLRTLTGLGLLGLALAACDEEVGVTLLFERGAADPAEQVFPIDEYKGEQVLDKLTTEQKAALPFLQQLRFTAQIGWSPITALRIPFTPAPHDSNRWIDVSTVRPALRVYRVEGGVATAVELGEITFGERSGAVVAFPKQPWLPGTYAVAVRLGVIGTHGGGTVGRSQDATRILTEGDPASDDAFTAVAAADPDIDTRSDTLAFWTFTVVDATGQMQLLAAYVAGQLPVDRDGADEVLDITPIVPAETRELAVGGAQVLAQGDKAVAAVYAAAGAGSLPTESIDKLVGGAIATPVFVSDTQPSPEGLFLSGTFLGRNPLLPFQPTNPLSLSKAHPSRLLPYIAAFPKVHATPMPVIVAFHGVGRSKEDWLSFANTACKTGHALIAIDLYQHGDRQADIDVPEGDFADNVDAFLATQGVFFPDPFIDPTFLARTRDKVRQSIVDNLALIRLLASADGVSPLIDFDGDHVPDQYGKIRVVAQSLGAMVATAVVAVSPAIDRAILNVPGGDLTQIVTDSPRIHPDVDLLLYGSCHATGFGLLAGSKRFMVPDGPEREMWARVAETVTAATDPSTFAAAMVSGALGNAQPRLLIQFAHDDLVVPNNANIRYAQAMAAGAAEPTDVPQLAPVLFDLGLPDVDANQAPLLHIAVSEFAGGHGFLLDFVDPAVTAAAQTQAATFLAAP
ncbi:MAG: hypothetical protein U1F43_31670 [Myxococcota bacterium]